MGSAIVLVTWVMWLTALVGIGHMASFVVSKSWGSRSRLEASAWIGLIVVALLASTLHLVLPLGGRASASFFGFLGLVGVINTLRIAWNLRESLVAAFSRSLTVRRWPVVLLLAMFSVGLGLIANFALAEPMDYDAGLYRISAILYAQDYSLPPGLANLHGRFGFNSSLWPLAALMGAGIWEGQGFRLISGLFVTILYWSIVMRVGFARRGGALPGDWFTVLGGAFVAAMALTDSGRWIPSPAQDLVLLVAGIGSTAYFIDYLVRRTSHTSAAMALLLTAFAGTLRPLGWVLFTSTLLVLLALLLRPQASAPHLLARAWSTLSRPLIVSSVLLGVMLTRDLFLSGWLLYPLTYAPMPVDWRAPDPTSVRNWITWFARAPGTDGTSAQDGSWISPWLQSTWASREIAVSRWMVAASVAPLLWRKGRVAWKQSWKVIVLGTFPSFAVTLLWFITAPDVRFGWLGILGMAAIPVSILFSAGGYPYWAVQITGVLLLVLLLLTQVLNSRVFPRGTEREPFELKAGPISLSVQIAPPQRPITVPGTLADGTPVNYTTQDPNCWALFPLCLPGGAGFGVERRGPGLEDGFRTER